LGELRKSLAFMAAEQGNEPEKLEIAVDEQAFDQVDQSMLLYDYGFTLFFKDVYGRLFFCAHSLDGCTIPVCVERSMRCCSWCDVSFRYSLLLQQLRDALLCVCVCFFSSTDEMLRDIKYSGQPSPMKQTQRSSQKSNQRQADEIKQLKKQLEVQSQELEIYKLQTSNLEQQVGALSSLPNSPARPLTTAVPTTTSARESELQEQSDELRRALEQRSAQDTHTSDLQVQYNSLVNSYGLLESALQQKSAELAAAQASLATASTDAPSSTSSSSACTPTSTSSTSSLHAELEQLRIRNDQLTHERSALKSRAAEERDHLLRQLSVAQAKVKEEEGTSATTAELEQIRTQLSAAQETIAQLRGQLAAANQEYTSLEAEQEELLVCLAKVEMENTTLKVRLEHSPI
jgi:chromosome segregation ATPase